MIIAIFLGILTGIIGFFPLLIALKISKKITLTSNFGYASLFILSVFVSLLIMVLAVIACIFVDKSLIAPFGIGAAASLSVFAIGAGIYINITRLKYAKARKEGFKKEKEH